MDYKIRVCGKDSIPLQDFKYLVENQVFSEKCANAKSVRTIINYTFQSLPSEYKYAKQFAKFSKPKGLQEKLKLCKFPLKVSVQKIDAKFLCGNWAGKTICFIASSNT